MLYLIENRQFYTDTLFVAETIAYNASVLETRFVEL